MIRTALSLTLALSVLLGLLFGSLDAIVFFLPFVGVAIFAAAIAYLFWRDVLAPR